MKRSINELAIDLSGLSAGGRKAAQIISDLISALSENSSAAIQLQFTVFVDDIRGVFAVEEGDVAKKDADSLEIQQGEHAALSRMLSNMQGLMDSSEQLRWRTAVVDEAVDALIQHFAKRDAAFAPLIGRYRRRTSSQKI